MDTVRSEYSEGRPFEEVQPVFVDAMVQESNNQETGIRNRKRAAKPLLSKQAAALKDEEDREALEIVLQRQLSAFTSKLEYLEQFADTSLPLRAKTRAGPRRRRRVVREDMHLAPLGPGRSNLQAAKSLASLPSHYVRKDDRNLRASTSLQILRPLSQIHPDNGDAEDAQDDAERPGECTCGDASIYHGVADELDNDEQFLRSGS
ncbi:unnamed protein product [Phytophthora fragariaefolia]|uniref:Unnamed protein product n=1 Tax=Phytophthora fragariaefolia TaxID=1490495 RepID=A0A9W6XD09_9STRA|nr:unnamed protein product [Phytophthora fragariaefolia]